jgi:hypothetical protein
MVGLTRRHRRSTPIPWKRLLMINMTFYYETILHYIELDKLYFLFMLTVLGYPSEDGSVGPSDLSTYIMTSESVQKQARLVKFRLFSKKTNPVHLQIWRKTNANDATDNTYTVVHTQQYVPTQTDQEFVVSVTRAYFIVGAKSGSIAKVKGKDRNWTSPMHHRGYYLFSH